MKADVERIVLAGFACAALVSVAAVGAEPSTESTLSSNSNRDFQVDLFEPTPPRPFLSVEDGYIEEACIFEIEAVIRPKVVRGELGDYAVDQDSRLKRTCVVMSLCDTANGMPDYFASSQAMSGSSFGRLCKGVTAYGRTMIGAEPKIFEPILEVSSLFRNLYRDEGRAAAMTQARRSAKKPEAFLDLGGRVSPFTIE